jgi:DNA repair protein RadC
MARIAPPAQEKLTHKGVVKSQHLLGWRIHNHMFVGHHGTRVLIS